MMYPFSVYLQYNPNMSNAPDNNDADFYALLFQWAARASLVAFEMVLPAIIGVGLDRLFGTGALFAVLGVILGMVLAFWQLYKLANIGLDKPDNTGDNGTI